MGTHVHAEERTMRDLLEGSSAMAEGVTLEVRIALTSI
jgi:hypothetical protein